MTEQEVREIVREEIELFWARIKAEEDDRIYESVFGGFGADAGNSAER